MRFQLILSFRTVFFWILAVFLVVEISDALLPFDAQGHSFESSAIYYSLFLLLFFFFLIISFVRYSISVRFGSNMTLHRVINSFLIISILSLAAVFYDRIYIQGVNYSDGVALARESWRAMSESREGVSSIFNVVGNLLFPFAFFVFSLSYSFYENISRPKLKLYGAVLLIFLFSVLTGGRELLLVLCSIGLSALCFRSAMKKPSVPKAMKLDVVLFFLLVVGFSIYIGYVRSQSYVEGIAWYVNSLAERLGGYDFSGGANDSMVPSVLMPVLIYVAHVKWILINVIEGGMEGGLSTFRQIFIMLDRYTFLSNFFVGFPQPTYSPNWISGVGSIYYDFGYFGLLLSGVFFSLLWFSSLFFLKVYEFSFCFFSVLYFYIVCATLIMLPFAFMFEVVQFIYLCVPLLFTFVWSFLVGLKGRSTYESRIC